MAAILLGVVEGLTEFLPVSSTAHLRIAQELIGQDLESGYWKMFAVVIQFGAILAVVAYFWKRILGFLRSHPLLAGASKATGSSDAESKGSLSNRWWTHPVSLVLISFVVTAVPCFIIDNKIGDNLESPKIMGWALLVGGVVMLVIDRVFENRATTKSLDKMSLGQAIFIGFTQIFSAAFPGTSRSMATIAGGQVMGLDRATALEFSFFLSIPVMMAASSFKLLQFIRKSPEGLDSHQMVVLAIGFVVSFLVAWVVIAWFMGWVRRRGFTPLLSTAS